MQGEICKIDQRQNMKGKITGYLVACKTYAVEKVRKRKDEYTYIYTLMYKREEKRIIRNLPV